MNQTASIAMIILIWNDFCFISDDQAGSMHFYIHMIMADAITLKGSENRA
ncbi:hypothetical protein QR674_05875 [Acinetobacter chinensis]|uniref:Uncharacterized protein n=1 Tax=Acinetobacter chinensis TaxID=2004650 RepID=A0ABU3WDN1_9GAMM|nr:hypothetical protein [Acinetobacter chinensis]MDV2468505.1 hypothetical protein [Acinetobacter chinensis]